MAKKMEAGQTQTLKKVLHYMKPYRFFLLLSVILAAITVASTLYLPLLIGKAVDCIVGKGNVNFDGLIAVLIKMAVIIGITALAQWIMNVCNNKLTYQIVRDIRNEAFEKIEVLPLKYIDGHEIALDTVLADTPSSLATSWIVIVLSLPELLFISFTPFSAQSVCFMSSRVCFSCANDCS